MVRFSEALQENIARRKTLELFHEIAEHNVMCCMRELERTMVQLQRKDDDPDGDWDDRENNDPEDSPVNWRLGDHKSETQWANRMRGRNWTPEKITQTIAEGEEFPAPNNVNEGNDAIRYLMPDGSFVVRDEVTKEILQVSDRGFIPQDLLPTD